MAIAIGRGPMGKCCGNKDVCICAHLFCSFNSTKLLRLWYLAILKVSRERLKKWIYGPLVSGFCIERVKMGHKSCFWSDEWVNWQNGTAQCSILVNNDVLVSSGQWSASKKTASRRFQKRFWATKLVLDDIQSHGKSSQAK